MSQKRKVIRRFGGFVMCAGLGFFVYAHFTKETFPILDCERHEMFIGDERIVGVEDLAFDAVENEIYFSAYDRRAGTVGGLYRFSALDVSGIEKLKTPNAPLTPHGFDLTRRGSELSLTVIDRDLSSETAIAARLRRFKWSDDAPEIAEPKLDTGTAILCNANDLISGAKPNTYFVTNDHASCTYRGRKFENVFTPNSASVLFLDLSDEPVVETRFEKLYFANGIANAFVTPGEIVIAETRKKRLSISAAQIELPGGPDNITVYVSKTGPVLWTALHPNLMSFGAYRAGWKSKSKSRVARVNMDGNMDVYDIPSDIISGATTALQAGDRLYVAGAFETAIASCSLLESSS